MQLTGNSSIRGALTAITAALLGTTGIAHAEENNRIESSLLLYSETNRVQAAEGIFSLTKQLRGGRLFNARITLDGLTGSSPNGAAPSNHIQTFTRPSGSSSYSVKAGEIPLDNTFKDTRYSLDGGYTLPVNRMTTAIVGAHLSTEHDYTSLGINGGLTRDFNRRNTTLSASLSLSHDLVSPRGGAPTPLTSMAAPSEDHGEHEGEDDEGRGGGGQGMNKNVFDAVFGVTQVLDRRTVARFNYSFNHSSGYLNDPYKFVSVVQGPAGSEPGEPVDYIYEARPGSRSKHALFGELRRYFAGHTIDLSYRYFWDTWGIRSNTIDAYYHLPIAAGHSLEPHFRYYKQTEADFYSAYLVDGPSLPTSASADYRLAPFHALTYGLQYLFPLGNGSHLSLGAEYYHQAGDLSPPKSLGTLSTMNLFPEMKAVMVRVGFSRAF